MFEDVFMAEAIHFENLLLRGLQLDHLCVGETVIHAPAS